MHDISRDDPTLAPAMLNLFLDHCQQDRRIDVIQIAIL